MSGRRVAWTLGLTLVLAATAVGAAKVWRDRRIERTVADGLADARRDREAGRVSSAAGQLAALERDYPGRDDVAIERAETELARDRPAIAVKLLEPIRDESPHATRAALLRGQAEIILGGLARAEDTLNEALRASAPGPDRIGLRDSLVRLLRAEGRIEEARRIFLEGQPDWADPIAFLRRLDRLDVEPFPIEGVRVYLDRAAKAAPDDDRVWLGRARLLLREGRFDEARTWLEACRKRRPDDQAVWDAWLDWAEAAQRFDVAREALAHRPSEPRALLSWKAWLARRARDTRAEVEALEQLVQADPGRVEPLDRLAEIALAAGDRTRAAQHRAQQAEINRRREALRAILTGADPVAHAKEISELYGKLGQTFESRAWAAIARREPIPTSPPQPRGPSLAEVLGRDTNLASLETTDERNTPTGPLPQFVNDAEAVGLTFLHESGSQGDRLRLIPPITSSGGVGLLDYDGDGWLDVYCVQGGKFPPDPRDTTCGDRLYRNKGNGTFEDVTEASGLTRFARGYGHGMTVGDIDNDGRPDLFITRWGAYALYRNLGQGRFEDVTERWGLGGDRDWPTSAALADLDGDGDLDLYVCHYFRWNAAELASCYDPANPSVYRCSPRDFPSLPDHLFRNDGDHFTDVSEAAGIKAGDQDGRGFGVVASDLDEDGRLDLFVTNDMSANFLWRNLGGLRFEEIAHEAGVAGNASGGYQAGMGVASDDFDGDGRPDIAVTNFYNESTTFFQNLGGGRFADHTQAIGLAAPTRFLLGFGITFLDVDNDASLDLMTANGHITDGRPQIPWRMPAQLLRGQGGQVRDISARAGAPFALTHIGRALAAGDLDNDGRVDALMIAQDEPIVSFHNTTETPARSLTLALEARSPGTNRDAVGAVVTVETGGRKRVARRIGGGSYQTAADPRLRFGLAESSQADRVEVRWPSGTKQVYTRLPAGGHRLIENQPEPQPLPGFRPTGHAEASAHPSQRPPERQATP